MTVIAALRKWVAEVEQDAQGGEIPTALSASYVIVKEALAEYDRGDIVWSDFDRVFLKGIRVAA